MCARVCLCFARDDTDGVGRQYGLTAPVGWLLADLCRSPWRRRQAHQSGYLDAIVCDPPYGLRETIVCSRSRGVTAEAEAADIGGVNKLHTATEAGGGDSREAGQMMATQLIALAAEALVIGGRLVYWTPVVEPPDSTGERAKLPACLEEVERCQQILSRRKTGQGQATRKHKRKKQGKALADEEEVERVDKGQRGAERDKDEGRVKRCCIVLVKVKSHELN